ncbi:2-amino-3-ketobutyrate coenzyme A ligase [Burkholderia multivorans CGD2M]|nr:2-amino-3-ketobutyrate coenzyme A ligase [Burkholderia multivorans CGD2M]
MFGISNSSSKYRINAVNRTTDYNSSRLLRGGHEPFRARCMLRTLSGAL